MLKIAEALLYEKSIKSFIDDYSDNDKLKPKSAGSQSHLHDVQTKCVIQHPVSINGYINIALVIKKSKVSLIILIRKNKQSSLYNMGY